MGLFGPSKAALRAQAEEERRRREELERATRRPAWRRALGAVPWWLAVVLVATVGPPVAVFVTARLTVRAWIRWPRLVTGVGAVPWAVLGGPWWGALPLSLVTVAAVAWDIHMHPAPPAEAGPDRDVATWRTLVAGGDAPLLPGSVVADHASPVFTPDGRQCGRTLHVRFRDARQTRAAVEQARAGIAALWSTEDAGVTARNLRDESRVDVEILDRWWLDERDDKRAERLHDVHEWTGARLVTVGPDAGTFPIMPDADTGLMLHGRLWTPGAGVHDFDVSGVKGTGKTNAVMVLLSHLLSARVVALDLVDLKGGASLGMWRPACFRFGTTIADGFLAVERAIAVMEARLEVMAGMQRTGVDGLPAFINGEPWLGVECVDPHEGWPVYLLAYDEFPRMIKAPGFEARLSHLNDLSRAAGVAVLVIHQSNVAREGWGNLMGLRNNITKSGNVLAGRNDEGAAARSVGVGVRLDTLPPGTPGAMFASTPLVRANALGRMPFMSPAAIEVAVRAARPGTLEPAALAAVERVEAEHAAREAQDAARRAAAQTVPSGAADIVGPVDGLTEGERKVAAAFGGPGRAMKTGEIVLAGVPSSTFHAAKDGTEKRPGLVARGLLVSQGHGQWVATAALYERQGV